MEKIFITKPLLLNKELRPIIENYESFNNNLALKLINNLYNKRSYNKLSEQDKLALFAYKLRINNRLQKYRSAVHVYNEMEAFYKVNLTIFDIISDLIFSTLKIWRMTTINYLDSTLKEEVDRVERLVLIIKNDKEIVDYPLTNLMLIHYYWDVSYYYSQINEKKKELDFLRLALEFSKSINRTMYITNSFNSLIMYFYYSENLEELNITLADALNFLDSKNLKYSKHKLLQNLATENMWNGKLKKALELNMSVYDEIISNNSTEEHAVYLQYFVSIGISMIYSYQGQYKLSLDWITKAEPFAKVLKDTFNDSTPLASIYGNMGEIYLDLENNEECLSNLTKSLEIRLKQQGAVLHIADSYYILIKFFVNNNDLLDAEFHLKNFEELIKTWRSEYIHTSNIYNPYFSIAKALVLKGKNTMKTNYESQALLQKIIDDNDTKTELLIAALIPLIDLTIQEFKLFQNDEIFNKLRSEFNLLQNLASNRPSITLRINSLIMQGKMDVIIGNFEEFESFFKEALALAKEYEILKLVNWINSELEKFQNELQKWQILISSNTPLKEKLNLIELEEYVKGIQHILYQN